MFRPLHLLLLLFLMALLTSCRKPTEPPPPNTGPDTTSHSLVWQTDSLGDTPSYIKGIWGSGPNDLYAVGSFNFPGSLHGLAHWDGYQWTYLAPEALTGPNGLHAGELSDVFGTGSSSVWVVGMGFESNPWRGDTTWGIVAKWNGTEWIDLKVPAPLEPLISVWASSESDVWVSSNQGGLFHYDGVIWTRYDTGTNYVIWDLFGLSRSEVYVSGANDFWEGLVLRYDGEQWRELSLAPFSTSASHSTWGTFSGLLVNARSYGGMLWYRDEEWSMVDEFTTYETARRIRGNAANDIWVCGYGGLVAHYNGQTWKKYTGEFAGSENWALWDICTFSNDVVIAGDNGGGFDEKAIVLRGKRSNLSP